MCLPRSCHALSTLCTTWKCSSPRIRTGRTANQLARGAVCPCSSRKGTHASRASIQKTCWLIRMLKQMTESNGRFRAAHGAVNLAILWGLSTIPMHPCPSATTAPTPSCFKAPRPLSMPAGSMARASVYGALILDTIAPCKCVPGRRRTHPSLPHD